MDTDDSVSKTRCALHHTCKVAAICSAVCSHGLPQPSNMLVVPRNDIIIRDHLKALLVLRDGLLASCSDSKRGNVFTHVLLEQGSVLGAELVTLPEIVIRENTVALTDAKLCILPLSQIRRIIDTDVTFYKELLSIAESNIRAIMKQGWVLQGTRVHDRIERMISVLSQHETSILNDLGSTLEIPLSHESIALIVHAERATVSKSLKKMEKDGLIEQKPLSVTVKQAYWESKSISEENLWDVERFGY
jgi:CRP-like cAMP-binding protein